MATPSIERQESLPAEHLDAGVREAEAQLKVLTAKAEARKAKAEMDQISGLTAAKERVKKAVADMKQQSSANYAAAKQKAEQDLKELQTKLQALSDRYWAWDDASQRHFSARLDEAQAKIQVWMEQAKQKRTAAAVKGHDDVATLEEKIALARARAAEARSAGFTADARAALEDAAHDFDHAYDAAAKRYGKK